jgi:hypothetical protein
MASGIRVEINSREASRILRSAEVADKLESMGKAITKAANDQAPEHGYTEQEPFAMDSGKTDRAFVNVYTRTDLGKRMQAKHSTLTKALDAGRRA